MTPTLLGLVALTDQKQVNMMFDVLIALSAGCLGVFVGAQITEGALFVPYWKALPAKEFFELHQTYGKQIYRFFAPLTIAATILPLLTVAYGLGTGVNGQSYLVAMGFFTMLFFSTYYLYFKRANKRFEEASIPHEALPEALETWGNWHWGRVVFEFIAFVCALAVLIVR